MARKARATNKEISYKIDLSEKRRYIRHPISYPLKFRLDSEKRSRKTSTVNVSEGGLLFLSKKSVKKGSMLALELPFMDKIFKVHAKVMHAKVDGSGKLYSVGVAFCKISDALKVKLIEQLYLIDEYRHLRSIQLGREITLQEASAEWIKLYSQRFKKLYW